jgi:hypothetical protein
MHVMRVGYHEKEVTVPLHFISAGNIVKTNQADEPTPTELPALQVIMRSHSSNVLSCSNQSEEDAKCSAASVAGMARGGLIYTFSSCMKPSCDTLSSQLQIERNAMNAKLNQTSQRTSSLWARTMETSKYFIYFHIIHI